MFFSRKKEKPAETAPGQLEERVRALESRVRQLDDDMNDLFDRHQRLQGRRAKREVREEQAAAQPKTREEALNDLIRAKRAGIHHNGA